MPAADIGGIMFERLKMLSSPVSTMCLQVLGLLVTFTTQRESEVAELGVGMLQQCILRCAPHLGPDLWGATVQALREAASAELNPAAFW